MPETDLPEAEQPERPALVIVGDSDAPVCVDGVCAL